MTLSCKACGKTFELPDAQWPGDTINCLHCGAGVSLPKAETVAYATDTPLVMLSPQGGDLRPESIGDDEVLPPGAVLGQYRIEAFIGRGGMGTVYRAKHTMLQRTVAIKVLPPKLAKDREFVQRFQREALALAGLSHPNIVAVHDMGTQGEIYFFAMEYVEGANLRDLLTAKRIPPEEALKIVPQLCEALEYAHSKGVIHRDIKPENIILDRNGLAKVADFGLAKIVKGETSTGALTQTNVVMGTIEYMAPEQRDNMKTVDHRADIYSMGVVLYEMLTGELPIGRFEPPSRKVMVDVRMDDVVLKALEREPARRYQRASHLGTDVAQVRITKSQMREVPVVDLATGQSLGVCQSRSLAIRSGAANVRVLAWERAEIGVQSGDCFLNAQQSPPVLQTRWVGVGTGAVVVYVPQSLELDVLTRGGNAYAKGVVGTILVRTNGGDVEAIDLDGRVSIATSGGDVCLDGLKGADIDVRTAGGDVNVRRLDVMRGQVTIETLGGDVDITLTPTAGGRYQLFTTGGEIDLQVPMTAAFAGDRPFGDITKSAGNAAGRFGVGDAQLQVRSGGGDITLRAGVRVGFNGATVRDMWGHLSAKQKEKIGVYAIVSAALWLATPIFHTIVPALATTVFWGMAIALDIWKGYVRGQEPAAATIVPAPAPIVMPTEPGKPGPKVAAPASSVAAPASRPRMSVLAAVALIAGLPSLALGLTTAILSSNASFGDEYGVAFAWYWITLTALTFGSILTGLAACAYGVAALHHLREGAGTLYGRAGALIGLSFGVVGLAVPCMSSLPALKAASHERRQILATGDIVMESIKTGRPEEMWRLLSDGERVDEADFRKAHAEASTVVRSSRSVYWAASLGADRQHGSVTTNVHVGGFRQIARGHWSTSSNSVLRLDRDPETGVWTVRHGREFLQQIRGEDR